MKGDRACVAIVDDDRILMVRQTFRGRTFWTFPGGGIENGESPVQAATREVLEEVRVNIKILTVLAKRPMIKTAGTYYCYLGRITKGQIELGEDPELRSDEQELHEARWFKIDKLKDHPEVAGIYDRIIKK